MTRLTTSALAVAAAVLLVACNGDGGEIAGDPQPTPTSPASPASPSASPNVGTYPSFEPADYTYTLTVSCFCASAAAPIAVVVAEGEVIEATYTGDGRGVKAGTQAQGRLRLSINDVIEAANDTEAASVEVVWPAGQDYPSSVYVDEDERMIDEEIGYQVTDVVVS